MKIFRTIIISSLMFFVYWFSQLIPKKKGLWIFGAWNGKKYGDHSKYLYEFINNKVHDIRPIWLTRNQQAFDLISSRGYEVYWTYSLKGFFYSMIAEKAFVSVGLKDINRYTVNRKDVVMMWHGSLGIKKIVYDDTITRNKQVLFMKLLFVVFPFLGATKMTGTVISGSEEASKIFLSAFRVKEDQILLTGFPRNDAFFLNDQSVPILDEIKSYKKNGTNLVIYMPTHRKEGKGEISTLFDIDLDKLNQSLILLKTKLFIKLHYFHLNKHNYKNFSHVYFITDFDISQDIYTIIPEFDMLITDYSSIHFDYLLTNKPIIFAPFDQEKYLINDREFYYKYNDVTPGPKARNWDELLVYIDKFIQNPNLYEEERQAILRKFNKFTDSNNCQRVFSTIYNKTE